MAFLDPLLGLSGVIERPCPVRRFHAFETLARGSQLAAWVMWPSKKRMAGFLPNIETFDVSKIHRVVEPIGFCA